MQKELECPCVKIECERHGDCAACATNHSGKEVKSSCQRPGVAISEAREARRKTRLQAAGLSG